MVVYLCAKCEAKLSRPLASLTDTSLLWNGDEEAYKYPAGEPDFVPEGFVLLNPAESTLIPPSESWPLLNPRDLGRTELDVTEIVGCCGPSETETLNTDCPNGHKVGIEYGDCYTVHCTALDPQRVAVTTEHEPITQGLDTASSAEWMQVVTDGTPSDRRRAIVLLGLQERTEAIPVLNDVLIEGPEALRDSAIRALGRIGTRSAVDQLASLLSESGTGRRQKIVRALGEIDDYAATEILLSLLIKETDSISELRRSLKGRVPASRLAECFGRTPEEPARKVALELIAIEGTDRASKILRDVITDSSYASSIQEHAIGQVHQLDFTREQRCQLLLQWLDTLDELTLQRECIEQLRSEIGMVMTHVRPQIVDQLRDLHERTAIDPELESEVERVFQLAQVDEDGIF